MVQNRYSLNVYTDIDKHNNWNSNRYYWWGAAAAAAAKAVTSAVVDRREDF